MADPLDVTIDRADRDDVPRCVALSNWAAAHTTANFATEPEALEPWLAAFDGTEATHPWLVARHEGRLLGFARASPHRARGAYRWTAEVSVYVDPSAHGRRVGSQLYAVLLPTLQRQGFVVLLAGITSCHAASERLHEAFGFVRCGTFRRVGWKFGSFHDVGYWELQLHPEDVPPRALLPVKDAL